MNNNEFINSPDEGKHIFTPEEIQQCARDGICVGCGLCCIVFNCKVPNKAPIDANDESIGLEFKGSMQVCKHLTETHDGIFRCAIQTQKDHELLGVCREWKGNFTGKGISDRERAEILAAEMVEKHHFPENLATLEKLFKRGIVRITLHPMLRNPVDRAFFFQSILSMSKLPLNLLLHTDTRERFQRSSVEERRQFLDEIEFDSSNAVHLEFLAFLTEGE